MCGIVGVFGDSKASLEKASLVLSHRGPDDHGIAKFENVIYNAQRGITSWIDEKLITVNPQIK